MTAHQKRNQLRKLRFSLVSLVDRPDNPTAEVTFFKRAPDGEFEGGQNLNGESAMSTSGSMAPRKPAEGNISKGALPDGLPPEVTSYILKLEDVILKGAATLEEDELDGLDGDLDDEATDELDDEDYEDDGEEYEDDEDVDLDDELDDEDYDEDDDDEPVEKSMESILKSADPRIVAILKAQQEQLDDVTAVAERERSARLDVEFTKMASTLPQVGEVQALGVLLRKCAEALEPGTFKVLKGVLDRANDRLKEGDLFREIGRSGSGEFSAGSRLDQIAKVATEMGGEMTPEQRFEKALAMDKAAYDEFNNEFMGGIGR